LCAALAAEALLYGVLLLQKKIRRTAPRLSADGKFIRRPATGCYQEVGLFASVTVSPTPSHRKTTQAFRSALAVRAVEFDYVEGA
jgi:hypothetical protein